MMRAAAGLLLLFLAVSVARSDDLDAPTRYLANADKYFAAREAGHAVGSYKGFLEEFPNDPRADYAIYMIGESCRLARTQMIVPAYYFTEFNPGGDSRQYRALAQYLARTYGMYADVSEGDSYWYYDMRAYRELLKRYPKSQYADDCEFLLVEPQQQRRAWAIGMGPEVAKTAQGLIRKYETIFRRYPDTNRRDDIRKAVSELRGIEQRNTSGPPSTRGQLNAGH
jgi:outer membrane protein assembly factor BamD (BamD/ComL family)